MTISSFGKILTILDLFSLSRPIINIDIISKELGFSRPTSYRYLKELVDLELLQRLNGTSGDYILGSKISILDYISRTTDPIVHISMPYMQDIVMRTEFSCLLTQLNRDACLDIHDETFKNMNVPLYGRGCPRPMFVGASAKVILAQLCKAELVEYYQLYHAQFKEVGFAQNEDEFLHKLKQIKKQGFYFSNGELNPNISSIAVPVKFSRKERALALSVIATKNRFEFINLEKMVLILQENAQLIEQQFASLREEKSI